MAKKNVESDGKTVKELFKDEVVYSMPEFQRGYVWKEDNLEEFWEDLESLVKLEENPSETSFLGALVLQEDTSKGENSTGPERYIVIDGQQRLTTFYLTLLALLVYAMGRRQELHKQLGDGGHVDPEDLEGWAHFARSDSHHTYLFSREDSNYGETKLTPSLPDYPRFSSIVIDLQDGLKKMKEKRLPMLLSDKRKRSGKLFHAYLSLQKKIQFFIEVDDGMAEQRARYEKILNALTNRTVVVQIIAGPNLSAYEIFDRLNTSGVRLGTLDWVRNYTFGKATLGTSKKAEESKRFSKEEWRPFENQLQDVPGIQDIKLQEKFFIAYGAIRIKGFTTINKDIHLKAHWEEQIKTKGQQKPYGGAALIVDSLEEYLPSYLALSAKKQLPEIDTNPWGLDSNLWKLIENIKDISLPEATYPFLISVTHSSMEKDGLSVEQAMQAFEIVESFIVRLTLLGRSMAGLTSVFQPLWAKCGAEGMTPESISRGIEDKYRLSWSDDDEIRHNILTESVYGHKKRLKYILAQYEKKLWESHPADEPSLPLCEIDHIMSQKESEGEKERKQMCNTLGNLTLLEKKINRLKSAKGFEEVRELLKKSHLLSVEELLKDFDTWDTEKIKKRGEELGKWAVKRWPLK